MKIMNKLDTFTPLSEEIPNDMEMVIFIAEIKTNSGIYYITDPYCGWISDGKFKRWPHPTPPTHFKRIWG